MSELKFYEIKGDQPHDQVAIYEDSVRGEWVRLEDAEQLQQRVSELEQERDKWAVNARKYRQINEGNREFIEMQKDTLSEVQNELREARLDADAEREERDSLAAHVKRYDKAALAAICIMPSGEAKANLRDVYDESPQTSLAEHDAEVARKAFADGFRAGCDNPNGSDATDAEIEEAAKEYAERVKRDNIDTTNQ